MSATNWENDPEDVEAQLEWFDNRGYQKGKYTVCGNPACGGDWHGFPRGSCPGSHRFPQRQPL